VSKYNAACDTSEKGEKYWIDQDKAAIANIEATAKFANDQAKQQLYKASELDDGLHPSWNVDHETPVSLAKTIANYDANQFFV
jgi:hypothetical protein